MSEALNNEPLEAGSAQSVFSTGAAVLMRTRLGRKAVLLLGEQDGLPVRESSTSDCGNGIAPPLEIWSRGAGALT